LAIADVIYVERKILGMAFVIIAMAKELYQAKKQGERNELQESKT